MEKTYTTQGIVLQKKDWRESDSLFVIFTKDFGRLKLLGPGMKKINSKLAGQLSVPGIIDLMIVKSKTQDKIGSAFLKKKFPLDLETDYVYWCLFTELLDKGLSESQADEALWDLVVKSINWLILAKKTEEKTVATVFFMIKFLQHLGYQPELNLCVTCKKDTSLENFSFWENGLLCESCVKKIAQNNQTQKISKPVVDLLKTILEKKDLRDLVIKKDTFTQLWSFLMRWVPYILEKPLNSASGIKIQ